ncbi:MAG TPA: c-type cytochrome [Gammaproteobacteria bacterium]|nr:c-type cytochrome [Gammaproteobacteria bacterium]
MKVTFASMVGILLLLSASAGRADGDAERGQSYFAVCTTCHGASGEGMKEMNGPKLAGQEAWYIVRQLQNFKQGLRGADSRDVYGQQMAPIAQVLPDDQAIEDVAAYIESLGRTDSK